MNIFKIRPVPFYYVPFLFFVLIAAAFSCFKTEERTELKMATFVKITLCGPRWYNFKEAFDKAFSAVDRVETIADIYDDNSELSRLNQNAHIRPVVVSNELFYIIKESIRLSKNSNGAFDITVWPLVKLWKEHKGKESIPSSSEVKNILPVVGYDKIILDESERSVFFIKNGVAIDLSAIAKGYAVDCAVGSLKKCGFKSAMVNAGGDIYCLGKKNLLNAWRIGIADPRNKDNLIKILRLTNKAVASSGGYEQHFSYKGRMYSHLINPGTGSARESVFSSVTVVAPNCTLADGIATAISVGGESVKAKIEKLYPNTEIIIVD